MLEQREIDQATPDLRILSSEGEVFDAPNVTSIEPYLPQPVVIGRQEKHFPSGEAFVQVSTMGLQLGEHPLYVDANKAVHTTNVVYSEMYNMQTSESGDVTGYFFQYTQEPYASDGFGLPHPHSVPTKRLYKNEHGHLRERTVHKQLAWNKEGETIRVQLVTAKHDGTVTSEYLESRNLRFALDDKRRLDEARRKLRMIREGRTEFYDKPESVRAAAGMTHEEDKDGEVILFEDLASMPLDTVAD